MPSPPVETDPACDSCAAHVLEQARAVADWQLAADLVVWDRDPGQTLRMPVSTRYNAQTGRWEAAICRAILFICPLTPGRNTRAEALLQAVEFLRKHFPGFTHG